MLGKIVNVGCAVLCLAALVLTAIFSPRTPEEHMTPAAWICAVGGTAFILVGVYLLMRRDDGNDGTTLVFLLRRRLGATFRERMQVNETKALYIETHNEQGGE